MIGISWMRIWNKSLTPAPLRERGESDVKSNNYIDKNTMDDLDDFIAYDTFFGGGSSGSSSGSGENNENQGCGWHIAVLITIIIAIYLIARYK